VIDWIFRFHFIIRFPFNYLYSNIDYDDNIIIIVTTVQNCTSLKEFRLVDGTYRPVGLLNEFIPCAFRVLSERIRFVTICFSFYRKVTITRKQRMWAFEYIFLSIFPIFFLFLRRTRVFRTNLLEPPSIVNTLRRVIHVIRTRVRKGRSPSARSSVCMSSAPSCVRIGTRTGPYITRWLTRGRGLPTSTVSSRSCAFFRVFAHCKSCTTRIHARHSNWTVSAVRA